MISEDIQHFSHWLRVEKGYSAHTVNGYLHDVKEFFQFLAAKGGDKSVSKESVRHFVASLYAVNSSATVGRKLSALRTYFRFLCREGRMSSDPLIGLANPKIEKYIPVFLTVDEVFSLLEEPGEKDSFALRDIAIMELAALVNDVVGFKGEVIWDKTKPDGTMQKLLDVSAINRAGWQSVTKLRDGIEKTYQWYCNQLDL